MAATVFTNRSTGAALSAGNAGTATTETVIAEAGNTRFYMADDPAASATTNPIPIPPSGNTLSWWMTLGLKVTVAPAGTLNNQQVWFANNTAIATGVTLQGMDATFTPGTSGYVQATGSASNGTTLNTTNYTTLTAAPNSDIVTNWTAGAKKSMAGSFINGTHTVAATSTTAGITGRGTLNYLAMQMTVASTASAGTLTAKVLSWSYDET